MRVPILVISILLSCLFANGQGFKLNGKVKDNTGQPLTGAAVSILHSTDSTVLAGSVTDTAGNFSFINLQPGKIILKISFISFKDYYQKVDLNNPVTDIGTISMQEKASLLNEVNVNEKVIAVQQKGDTTQFNADAFKVNRDASAEDLATKMPGINIQDGKVNAQGEEVKKVLVNGKPFLGDDPNAAMKNFPAEAIEKIQVFDKKSDQAEFTGFDDGNSTKTINIVTRPQFRNGTFGRVFGGAGTEELWKSGFNINSFKDKRKFTILGNANNINEQNFSTDDLLGVVGTTASRDRPRGGNVVTRGGGGVGRYQQNDLGNFLVDQKNGIITTYAGGINYNNTWKKLDFAFSYFFNSAQNNSNTSLTRQYYTSEGNGLEYSEVNSGKSKNINHRANLKFEYKFDTLNSILFQPRISFQNNNTNSDVFGNNTDLTGKLNNTIYINIGSQHGYTASSPLLLRHAFQKKGRTISLNLNPSYNQNDGNGTLSSITESYDTLTPSSKINQSSNYNSNTLNLSSEINYTEPLSKISQLAVYYRTNYTKSESTKKTYSNINGSSDELDSSLSNIFNSNYLTHSPGINYNLQNDKTTLTLGIGYQSAQLKNENIFPNTGNIEKTFTSILPSAIYQYKFTPRKNIRLYYRSANNAPSLSQLQNVVNNNNPLQLSIGNPELEQDWQNFLNVRYTTANTDKNTSFFMTLSGSYTQDYIGNSSYISQIDSVVVDGIYLVKGSQLSKPVNLDGFYSLRSYGNYSFPLTVVKSTLNFNANANFTRTPSKINSELNYSKNSGAGFGISLSSNISEKIDFMVSSNLNYSDIKNTIDQTSNSNYYSLYSKLKTQVMPWKGLVIQTDIAFQNYEGLTGSYNQDYILWNAAIGYKFLKNRLAELRLSVFDILEQNKSISRNTTDLYYEDVQSNVLQQYFMLTFTYNIKHFKSTN